MTDRAWATRGLTSASPWGESVPSVLADTEVIFTRAGTELVPDGMGGLTRGATLTVLIAEGHVELRTETALVVGGPAGGTAAGTVLRRFYLAVLPAPDDPDEFPRRLDRMVFTDEAGVQRDLEVAVVSAPEGDHLEVESAEYE